MRAKVLGFEGRASKVFREGTGPGSLEQIGHGGQQVKLEAFSRPGLMSLWLVGLRVTFCHP